LLRLRLERRRVGWPPSRSRDPVLRHMVQGGHPFIANRFAGTRRWVAAPGKGCCTPFGAQVPGPSGLSRILACRSVCWMYLPVRVSASPEAVLRRSFGARGWLVGSAGRSGFGRFGSHRKADLVPWAHASHPVRRIPPIPVGWEAGCPSDVRGRGSSRRNPSPGAPAGGDNGPFVGRKPMGASGDSPTATSVRRNGLVDG
jgi:hypothetical protein